jgi:SAM-dependent methyltransferase
VTDIEQLIETDRIVTPDYSGRKFTEEDIARGSHRKFIGGAWRVGAKNQTKFLKKQGLLPEHKFLDIGCGPFRAGRLLVNMLDPGNYYGIDASRAILQAGYDVELTDKQRSRLPTANLRANDRFNVDFGVQFDMAIAQSVFTHLSLNHMRLCLFRLAKVMKPGGTFYASFFEQPLSTPFDHIWQRVDGGRAYLNEQNVFWYHRRDMRWASRFGPWRFKYIGAWGSQHDQMMVSYTRLSDDEIRAAKESRTKPGGS